MIFPPHVARSLALVALLCHLLATPSPAAEAAAAPSVDAEARLRRDITFLASDECEGRGPRTKASTRRPTTSPRSSRSPASSPAAQTAAIFAPFTIASVTLEGRRMLALKGRKASASS